MNNTLTTVARAYPIMTNEDHEEIARVADLYQEKKSKTLDESIIAAINYLEILDMVVDGVWIGLNIVGPMSFSHTTRQNHTVKMTMEAL